MKLDIAKYLIITFISSLVSLYIAFVRLKRRRAILDTPTSPIKSASKGSYVEISGNCISPNSKSLISPVSEQECVFYMWEIEEHSQLESGYRVVSRFFSDKYLSLMDDSNSVAVVDIYHAEFNGFKFLSKKKYRSFSDLNQETQRIFNENEELMTFLSDSYFEYYYIKETVIFKDQPLFVFGNSHPKVLINDKRNDSYTFIVGNELNQNSDNDFIDSVTLLMGEFRQEGVLIRLDKVLVSSHSQNKIVRKDLILALFFIISATIGLSLVFGALTIDFSLD